MLKLRTTQRRITTSSWQGGRPHRHFTTRPVVLEGPGRQGDVIGVRKRPALPVLAIALAITTLSSLLMPGCQAIQALLGGELAPTAPVPIGIQRCPPALPQGRGALAELPRYDPPNLRWTYREWQRDARHQFVPIPTSQVDLRGYDLSHLDLSERLYDLLHADFDSHTQWPENLPREFDPEWLMSLGKNPGLCLRDVHEAGITGAGVGIAVIDQPILVDHAEFAGRLVHYEEIDCTDRYAGSQGMAVASVAVGNTVGVAPGADLYYFAVTPGEWSNDSTQWDMTAHAKAVNRVLEINRTLPEDERIRVICISMAWEPYHDGFGPIEHALVRARRQGVFVVSVNLHISHALAFDGMDRDPRDNPDVYTSWRPYTGISQYLFLPMAGAIPKCGVAIFPMNSRCLASPTGPEDYVFYREGGWSLCVAYIAGLYALACQAVPEVDPGQFWRILFETADSEIAPRSPYNYEQPNFTRMRKPNPPRLLEGIAEFYSKEPSGG